jgi:hypothetical protein
VKSILLIVAVAGLCTTAYAGGNVIKYEQPVDENGYGYGSMNVLGTWNAADDFVCNGTGLVTDVHWWGVYYEEEGPLPIMGFNIRFYLDDGINGYGVPGTLVYDVVYSGNADETDTEMVGGDGYKIWAYKANIEPFYQKERETYWMSISALPGWDPFEDPNLFRAWGWRNAVGITGYEGVQADYGDHQLMWSDAWGTGTDFAFVLTTVPEPAAVTALAGLLLGLGGAILRRR